jgi:lipopolysaccharide biosynthesis regulator YciM
MIKKDLHFIYNSKIKSLYKKRNENEVYLKQCKEYCKRDIELYEKELRKMTFFQDNNTRIPAFQRLAIIYEKRKEYKKTIKVCKKAIKYNMREKIRIALRID